MKILPRTIGVMSLLLLSSCAEDMPQTYSGPKTHIRPPIQMRPGTSSTSQGPTSPSASTTSTASRLSNAERANNLHRAVLHCLGKGTSIGTPAYETCVINQLD